MGNTQTASPLVPVQSGMILNLFNKMSSMRHAKGSYRYLKLCDKKPNFNINKLLKASRAIKAPLSIFMNSCTVYTSRVFR